MYTSGQMINYNRYKTTLENTPAPILAGQLPKVHIDLAGMMRYAHENGKKAGDLTEEEKNRFISGESVKSLRKKVAESVKFKNLVEWNKSTGV